MLNKNIKNNILKEILSSNNFLGKYADYDGILTFLSKVWDLKAMPSEDSRYTNAYDDVRQHIVNNDDWTYEELFISRLKLIDGEETLFVDFIQLIVNPTVRENKDDILAFTIRINSHLKNSGLKLALTGYFEDLPVFTIRNEEDIIDLPIDIPENKIPIYLSTKKDKSIYPHFVLGYDRWNDFGYVTMMDITYNISPISSVYLDKIKILKKETKETWSELSEEFTKLSQEFCSLGQTSNYYTKLKELLGNDFYSFLLAIRDVAMFPKIHDQFETDYIFTTSLIRGNSVERLVRTIRFEIEGINPNEYFKFNFTNTPPYSEEKINLNFDFKYNDLFEQRVYALIGKNGTGKTRILSSLAQELGNKQSISFSPKKPIYGKVFTVSYSFFDKFEIPNGDASFNYVYCGLKKIDGSWKSEIDLLEGFYNSAKRIKKKSLDYDWIEILTQFLPIEIIECLKFKEIKLQEDQTEYLFDIDLFGQIKSKLSSGQSIILFIISEILSEIRFDSLILYDEPETHLHPNAISSLMNTLFEIVRRFKSFCIVATHSPIIIQEIPSRNILIIDREENIAKVRYLERESFGENLTVITQDIFGNSTIQKHFITTIQFLIYSGKTYDEIISVLESGDLPVTSNIRLYVKSLLISDKK